MDIISLGAATKAAMEEAKTRKQTLEVGVKGTHDNVAKRLEALETAYGNSVKKANDLIIKDAVNIMKAHARLNAVAQSKKYKMENMIFDDLLDLSGIDTESSSSYLHNASVGSIEATNAENVLVTKAIETGLVAEKVLVHTELEELRMEQNITLEGEFISIGNNARLNKSILTDGDLTTWGWDDYPTTDLQGFEVRYSKPMQISRVRIFAHTKYYMRGIRVTIDDIEVAYTTENVSGWFEINFNKPGSSIKITRIPGTSSYDQAISQIEIWDSPKDLKTFEISRDDGATWRKGDIGSLLIFDNKNEIKKARLVVKFNLPLNRKLLNYGLTWT